MLDLATQKVCSHPCFKDASGREDHIPRPAPNTGFSPICLVNKQTSAYMSSLSSQPGRPTVRGFICT